MTIKTPDVSSLTWQQHAFWKAYVTQGHLQVLCMSSSRADHAHISAQGSDLSAGQRVLDLRCRLCCLAHLKQGNRPIDDVPRPRQVPPVPAQLPGLSSSGLRIHLHVSPPQARPLPGYFDCPPNLQTTSMFVMVQTPACSAVLVYVACLPYLLLLFSGFEDSQRGRPDGKSLDTQHWR